MEAEIAHLKQENGILRDAVSNTTNQLESKYVPKCFTLNKMTVFSLNGRVFSSVTKMCLIVIC